MGKGYTAADALRYLVASDPLSGVQQELSDRFGYSDENEDVEFLDEFLDSIREELLDFTRKFNPRPEPTYSNGVPLTRVSHLVTVQPGEDGADEVVKLEVHHTIHPSGVMPPLGPDQVWADEDH